MLKFGGDALLLFSSALATRSRRPLGWSDMRRLRVALREHERKLSGCEAPSGGSYPEHAGP
jgi:hypothetical protein